MTVRLTAHASAAVVLSTVLAACGSSGPGPGPVQGDVRVTSVSPASGSTFGGTTVTITGQGFAPGATVQFGGVAATSVAVLNATTITAVTAARAAGAVEVRVTSAGQTATLAGAFTYVAQPGTINTPPVINSLTVRGPRANQPAAFANIGDPIRLEASVSDAETADTALTYEWTATPAIGTFSGAGREVEWLAPSSISSAQTVVLTLTVVERYQDVDGQGLPVQREHRVQRTVNIRVHDSAKEIGDMSQAFLEAFSRQLGTTETLKDFSRTCDGGRGYQLEFGDVQDNLDKRTITAWRVDQPTVSFAFAAANACPIDGTFGDACAAHFVRWSDVEKSTGTPSTVEGTDYVSAVYETDRWRLCHSRFDGRNVLTGQRVIR
jgi:hypothetical protein